MQREEILSVLGESGALLSGHFKLSSGRHADSYLQCAQVQQHPERLAPLCAALADKWREENVTVVVGPAMGGIVLAYELARQLDARGIFMERSDDGSFAFRRGFRIEADDRILVAEDVVTTGKSVKEVLAKLDAEKADVVGVASLVCRDVAVDFGVAYRYLIDFDLPSWEPQACPLCRQGVPVTKPGSRPEEESAA